MAGGTKTYADLSDAAVAFLSDIDAIDAAKSLAARFGARDAQALLSLAEDVALGEAALADIPRKLEELGVAPEKSREAAAAFATERLLPIAGEVGDVAGAIASWGGKAPASAPASVSGILAGLGVKMGSDALQKRLEFQVSAFLAGERDEAAAVAMMTRPSKVGGLDMSEADARALLAAVKGRGVENRVERVETAERAERVEEVAPAPKPQPQKPTPPPLPTPPTLAHPSSVPADPSSIPDQMAAAAGLSFANPDLKKRFDLAVDARLRDVRDAFETRAVLEQPTDKGGLGIAGAPLAAAMEALEALVGKRAADLAASAAQGKTAALAQEAKARQEKEAAARASEEAALAKRYAELTGTSPQVPQAVPAASMKAAAAARVSASTVPPAPGRPRLDDVRAARRLAGPVDELRTMGVADFRRLSKDPEEAARKVRAKVALLEEQGYEQRIAAVKAWRESGVNRLYAALSQEAFASGRDVAAVASERRKAMPEMFSPGELAAVIALNAELRF